MQLRPKKKIAPAAFTAGTLLGVAAVFVVFMALDAGLFWLNLPAAFLLALLGLLFLRRYLLTDVVYDLNLDRLPALLSFHLIRGKSSRKVGVLPLFDCEALLPLTRKNKKALKGRKKRGDLRTNFLPSISYALLYREEEIPCYLLFEPDETLIRLLERELKNNEDE